MIAKASCLACEQAHILREILHRVNETWTADWPRDFVFPPFLHVRRLSFAVSTWKYLSRDCHVHKIFFTFSHRVEVNCRKKGRKNLFFRSHTGAPSNSPLMWVHAKLKQLGSQKFYLKRERVSWRLPFHVNVVLNLSFISPTGRALLSPWKNIRRGRGSGTNNEYQNPRWASTSLTL